MRALITRLFGSTSSFLASSAAVSASVPRMRFMDVISPPTGVEKRIEWNLDDPESMQRAQVQFDILRHASDNHTLTKRLFHKATDDGVLGRQLKSPDIQENMISLPEIHQG